MPLDSVGTPLAWVGFIGFVLALLSLDLGVFHRRAHAVTLKESATWSAVWIALALIFNACVYFWFGPERALEFTTGYLIEKALAVDNIFVFVVIFSAFAVPARHQHRILFWGVLGALLLRALFILLGGAFLQRFHWAIYVLGGILVVTGIKLLWQREAAPDPERNLLVRAFRRFVPVTHEYEEGRFIVSRAGKRYATPLLLALVTIEISDVVFAVDSIPAIFAVTRDPFIVFTSNVFAILGLRSLYFLLAGLVQKFAYLSLALSVILIFVGLEMLLLDVYQIPIAISLGVIAGVLALASLASWWRASRLGRAARAPLSERPRRAQA